MQFSLAILIAFCLMRGSVAIAAAPAGPATSRQFLPTLLVPPRMGEHVPAVWDTLARIEVQNRWAVSESLATVLVKQLEAESPTDSLTLAHALLYVANGWIKQRKYAGGSGFETLERAIGIRERKAGRNDRLAIWGHLLGAAFYSEAGKPDLARAHAETTIGRLEANQPVDAAWLSNARLVHANALTALREWDRARSEYEAAIEAWESVDGPESRLLVPMLAEYGSLLSRIGEFDRARELLQRAIHIAAIAAGPGKSSDFLEGSLSRLSTLENKTGNVAESLDLAQRAYWNARMRLGDAAIPTLRFRTIIAYRLKDLGDYRGAAGILREIVPAMASGLGPQHPQTLNARLTLIESMLGIPDTTAVAVELALTRQALAGQDPLANSNWIYLLTLTSDFEWAQGNVAAARETLNTALEIEKRKHDPTGDNYAGILGHALKTVQNAHDLPYLKAKEADIDHVLDSTTVRTTAEWPFLLRAQSAAEARAGLRDRSWKHGLEAEEVSRARLGYEIQALSDRRSLQLADEFGESCDLLVSLMRPDQEEEIHTAWDRIVGWRGLVRHEIARRRMPPSAASDSVVINTHESWLSAQRQLGQLVVSGAANPDNPETRNRFEAARRDAEEKERRYVHLAGMASEDSLRLEDVLARLESNQALVAFAIGSNGSGRETLGAFTATGKTKRPEWVALGPVSDIEKEVHAWLASLGSPPPADIEQCRAAEKRCRETGDLVRRRLWQPIASRLGESREIFLVPEGVANQVAWLALPEPKGKYLAERAITLRIVEAERDLLQPPPAAVSDGLLAVGGPDFNRGNDVLVASTAPVPADASRAWRCTGSETLNLQPLPAAKKEAEDVAHVWGRAADLLVGADATERALKSLAPGKTVIHIATHGIVVDDTCSAFTGSRGVGGVEPIALPPPKPAPKTSSPPPARNINPWLGRQVWLALSGANHAGDNLDENEGLLTAEEIVTLDLRGTEWVVLSACQSALGSGWTREGVLGMQRSFHLAGARSVIASHWSIGDESTREWMNALYAARTPGKSSGAAVGDACRAVLAARRASGRSTHPFYWAAFTANGE